MKVFSAVLLASLAFALPAAAQPNQKGDRGQAKSQAKAKVRQIDINSASAVDLAPLPGVGAKGADAIVKGRPYATKSELVEKQILTPAVFENIEMSIVVR